MFPELKDEFKSKLNSSLTKNYIWVFFGQNAGSVFSMLTLVFTLRIITTDEYASLVVIQAYCLLISNLLSLRTFNGLIKFATEALLQNDYGRVRRLFNTAFLYDVVAGVASLVCGYALVGIITPLMGWRLTVKADLLMYLPVVVFYPILNGAPVGILRKLDKFKEVNLVHASVYGLQFCTVLLLWITRLKNHIILYCIYASFEIVECIALVLLCCHELNKNAHYRGFWKDGFDFDVSFIKYNLYYGLTISFDQLLGNVSTLLINKYIGNLATAYLKIVTRLCSIITKFTSPVSQVFYPELCKWIAEKKYKKSLSIAVRYFVAINVAGLFFVLVFAVLYDTIKAVFGESMDGALLQSLLYLGYSVLSVSIVFFNQMVFAMNLMKQSLCVTAIVNILYIMALIPCIKQWGIYGYLALQILQLLIVFLCKLYYIIREMDRDSHKESVLG